MCEISMFCTQESRDQLESVSKLPLVIMSKMILDSLGNIKFGKVPMVGKPSGAKLLKAPAASKISRHLFARLLFEGSKLQNFGTEMGKRMMAVKQLHWVYCDTAKEVHTCDRCHFAFLARQAQVTATFHRVRQNSLATWSM